MAFDGVAVARAGARLAAYFTPAALVAAGGQNLNVGTDTVRSLQPWA